MKSHVALVAAIVTAALAIIASVDAARADADLVFKIGPPHNRAEPAHETRPGYIWVNGYWDGKDGKHEWVEGHYERVREGLTFNPSRWVLRDGNWVLIRGGWAEESKPDPAKIKPRTPLILTPPKPNETQ